MRAHDQRQRGPTQALDYFALARVGDCDHASSRGSTQGATQGVERGRARSAHALSDAIRDARCPSVEASTRHVDLLKPQELERIDQLGALALTRVEVMSGSGGDELTSTLSPQLIARLRVAWELAERMSDLARCQRYARALSVIPAPRLALERLRLSEARCAIEALMQGPPEQLNATPERIWRTLRTLAQRAKGDQVRAEALSLIAAQPMSDVEPREAREAYRALWLELPQTPPARALTASPDSPDWMTRGDAAFKARDYQLTIDALRRSSPISAETARSLKLPDEVSSLKGVTTNQRASAALKIAISLMRLRIHPDEAERQLKRAEQSLKRDTKLSAIYYSAHLLSRHARWDESLDKIKAYIARAPRGRRRYEMRYQVGRVLHQAGRYTDAVIAHERFLKSRPRDRVKYEWFLGWSHFRAGDCPQARSVWGRLNSNRNLLVGPKALYWTARCYALEGKRRLALKTLKRLKRDAELSYYGLLGVTFEARLRGRALRWRNPLAKSRRAHWREGAPALPTRQLKRLERRRRGRDRARRARVALSLSALGEGGPARVLSRALCPTHSKRARRARRRRPDLLCDRLEFYSGDHGALWRRQAPAKVAWRTGFKSKRPAERVGAYPLAHYELSLAAAELESITPWWLMSHMLQESRYRPEVVSYAQAIGLMQILGRTGKRIHARLKWPAGDFFSDQLFDPALSIRYAAWYLSRLSDDLGHPLLAIGAYNGGPMRFADHQDLFQGQPFDVMVEEMGAHESRNYLRKVTDHLIRYLALYASVEEWETWTQRLAPPELTPKPKRTVGF